VLAYLSCPQNKSIKQCFFCLCILVVRWQEAKQLEMLQWLLIQEFHWPAARYQVQYRSVIDQLRTVTSASSCQFKPLTFLSPARQDRLNSATSRLPRNLAWWHQECDWSSRSRSTLLVHAVSHASGPVVAFLRSRRCFQFFCLVRHQLPLHLPTSRICVERLLCLRTCISLFLCYCFTYFCWPNFLLGVAYFSALQAVSHSLV